jgi:hypothetical protein
MPSGRPAIDDQSMSNASNPTERRLCRLQYAANRIEDCPEGRCPFWEAGGAVLDARCAIDHVDIDSNPALVSWLLELRSRLEVAGLNDEPEAGWRLFHRLRPQKRAHPRIV